MADETAQGIAAAGALKNAERKAMAFNALAKSYGPQALDPEAWGQDVQAATAEAKLPYAGPQAAASLEQTKTQTNYMAGPQTKASEAATAATMQNTKLTGQEAQRNAQVRALKMLQPSVDPSSGSVSGDDFDRIVGKNSDALGIDPDHLQPLKDALTAPGGAAHLDTIMQGLLAPQQATGAATIGRDEQGNTIAVRFDKNGNPIKTNLGGITTTAQQNADTGVVNAAERQRNDRINAALRKQGIDVQKYNAAIREANSAYGAGDASAPGGGGAPAASAQPETPKPGAVGTDNASATPMIDRLPLKGQLQVRGMAQGLVNNSTTVATANTLLDSVDKQISPFTTGVGSLMKNLPGSVQNDIRANLESIKAQGLQTWLTSMKNASGQTGLGRILQTEVQNAQTLYGNMEQDQSTKQLKLHLDLFRAAIKRMEQTGRAAFTKTWKATPEAAIGVEERGAAPLSDDDLLKKYGGQ